MVKRWRRPIRNQSLREKSRSFDVTRASVAPITVASATPPVEPVGMSQRRDWIREGAQTRDIDRTSQCNNDARIGLIPKPQVPPFEGGKKGIIQFPAFSAHFKYFVHDVLSCEPTKLSILRAYLPATVREEIGESVLIQQVLDGFKGVKPEI